MSAFEIDQEAIEILKSNIDFYGLSNVDIVKADARLHLETPVTLATYPGHKVEAIGCWAGKGLLGTDDENGGGYIASHPFC